MERALQLRNMYQPVNLSPAMRLTNQANYGIRTILWGDRAKIPYDVLNPEQYPPESRALVANLKTVIVRWMMK